MIPMTAQEIAAAAGGTLYGKGMASAVSTDSRSIQPGCLFVPLIGERFDGHSYIDASLSAGAARLRTGSISWCRIPSWR